MAKVRDLHRQWMKEPAYKGAYDALDEEFQLAATLIAARTAAGLSQAEVARRMETSQSYVARLESGDVQPSTAALFRFARATRSTLTIKLEPTTNRARLPALAASASGAARVASPKKRAAVAKKVQRAKRRPR